MAPRMIVPFDTDKIKEPYIEAGIFQNPDSNRDIDT